VPSTSAITFVISTAEGAIVERCRRRSSFLLRFEPAHPICRGARARGRPASRADVWPQATRRALMKVRGPAWSESPRPAIGGSELLDLRVAQLESARSQDWKGSHGRWLRSRCSEARVRRLFVASIVGFGGPRRYLE